MHPSVLPIRHFFVRVRVVSFRPRWPGHVHVPIPVREHGCSDLLLPFPVRILLFFMMIVCLWLILVEEDDYVCSVD